MAQLGLRDASRPSIPGVASLKQSRNRRAPGLRTFSSPVRCRANNSQAGFRAPDETCLHTCSPNLYPKVQPTLHAIAGSCSSFVTSLYLFSVSECINKLSFCLFAVGQALRVLSRDNFFTKT